MNSVALKTLDQTRILLDYINQDVCKDWPEQYKAQAYVMEDKFGYIVKCYLTKTDLKEALTKLGLKGTLLQYEERGDDN